MPKLQDAVTEEDLPGLLEMLVEGKPAEQCDVLRKLCPCRSRVYDREAWRAIFEAYRRGDTPEIRHQAEHAIETLWERAQTDAASEELVHWLVENGCRYYTKDQRRDQRGERIRAGDVPRLLEVLQEGDEEAQCDALTRLCPCRNRCYDREVWLAIFRVFESDDGQRVRDRAGHAIGTLLQRARRDPRTQDLLRWLSTQGDVTVPVDQAIPVWSPRAVGGGLRIPPMERGHRSKANRRR